MKIAKLSLKIFLAISAFWASGLCSSPLFAESNSKYSPAEESYFRRSGFYSLVGESFYKDLQLSVFIAGKSGEVGIVGTEVGWAFRQPLLKGGRAVSSVEWQIEIDCNGKILSYISYEEIDERRRVLKRGPAALWSESREDAVPGLLAAEIFGLVCGVAQMPTVVALGERGTSPANKDSPSPPQSKTSPVPNQRERGIDLPGRKVEPIGLPPIPISYGTGFFVNGDGMILTNAHVVAGCARLFVGQQAAEVQSARLMSLENSLDLALLRTSLRGRALVFKQQKLEVGEEVLVFGFPLTSVLSSSGVATTGIVSAITGIADDPTRIQISAPIQPGNSGGAVTDLSGAVVGVVVSKLNAISAARSTGDIPQNVNFAVKLDSVKRYLRGLGVPFSEAEDSPIRPMRRLVDRVRQSSVKITCSS